MRSEQSTIKILDAGVKLAKKHGLDGFKRGDLAEAAKVSPSLITNYLGNMAEMRAAIRKYAKKNGVELIESKKPKVPTKAERLLGTVSHTPVPVKAKKVAKPAAKKAPTKLQQIAALQKPKAPTAKKAAPTKVKKPAVAVEAKKAARKPKAAPVIVIPQPL